jgi:hypothetical protein
MFLSLNISRSSLTSSRAIGSTSGLALARLLTLATDCTASTVRNQVETVVNDVNRYVQETHYRRIPNGSQLSPTVFLTFIGILRRPRVGHKQTIGESHLEVLLCAYSFTR